MGIIQRSMIKISPVLYIYLCQKLRVFSMEKGEYWSPRSLGQEVHSDGPQSSIQTWHIYYRASIRVGNALSEYYTRQQWSSLSWPIPGVTGHVSPTQTASVPPLPEGRGVPQKHKRKLKLIEILMILMIILEFQYSTANFLLMVKQKS